jgi:glutaconate CoA-transferase subunit B
MATEALRTATASGITSTPGEVMVVAAAREIRDGEVVFVGMRLPLLAFCLAKRTHAPRAVGLFESGVIRDSAPPELLYTMCDPPNLAGAAACVPMMTVMSLLQRGQVDVGFLGGAQIDRYGNLNTSCVGEPGARPLRLPGSGGAADIACLSKRVVILMTHERRRFRERVDFITSPGHGDGPGWRGDRGLRGGGPATLITTLGVFCFDPETAEVALSSYHPHVGISEIRQATDWDLRLADDVAPTPEPTAEELAVIREYDPGGFWTNIT